MKMCVYDLAVGSDTAVNETQVAKVRRASRRYHNRKDVFVRCRQPWASGCFLNKRCLCFRFEVFSRCIALDWHARPPLFRLLPPCDVFRLAVTGRLYLRIIVVVRINRVPGRVFVKMYQVPGAGSNVRWHCFHVAFGLVWFG